MLDAITLHTDSSVPINHSLDITNTSVMWPKLQNKSGVDLKKGFASLLTNYYGIDPVSRLHIDSKTNTKGTNQ